MKKFLCMLMILATVFACVACVGGGDEELPVDTELYPEKEWEMMSYSNDAPVEIKFWIPNSATSPMGQSVQDLADLFNQQQRVKYPGKNISVVPEFQGTSGALNTKLQAAILAGNNPVLSAIGVSSVPLYYDRSADLRTVYTYDELKAFNQGLLQYSLYGGKFMLNPYYASASNVLVVNKTLIASKGLTIPTPSEIMADPAASTWTWDNFKKLAKDLTAINAADDSKSVYGFATGSIDPIGMMFQQGGKLYNDNVTEILFDKDDMMKKGLEFWRSLVTENAMRNPNSRANHGTIITSEFYDNKVGMLFTTSSNLKLATDEAKKNGFEIEVMPFPKQSDFYVNQGGSGMIILDNKPKKEQEAAAVFMRWLTEAEQTAYMCSKAGYLPLNPAANDTAALKSIYKDYPTLLTVSEFMKFGKRSPQGKAKAAVDSKVNGYGKEIWSELNKSIDAIIAEIKTAAEFEIEASK